MLTFPISARVRSALFLLALSPISSLITTGIAAAADSVNTPKKCLYISSYHRGYEWSDGVERGLRDSLAGHCDVRQLDMDTKRNKNPEFIFSAVNRAIKMINDWQPDVVITSDDNAAKYLIAPHYRDDPLPFVFSGVNWTVDEYGFPYSNVTGIVEVIPLQAMLKEISYLTGDGKRAMYIAADTLSVKKNFDRYKSEAEKLGIEMDATYALNFKQWQTAMANTDDYDFVIVGGIAGITDWNNKQAEETALMSKSLTVTTHHWLMPYSSLGFTILATEHGEWSGKAAVAILNGTAPSSIPIASNKEWDLWINEELLNNLSIDIGRKLKRKAKRVAPRKKIESAQIEP